MDNIVVIAGALFLGFDRVGLQVVGLCHPFSLSPLDDLPDINCSEIY